MNIDLSRRLATSTRPWSSTSPSTSSCRWCLARRSCTPTTSSSSRWTNSKLAFGKNAFQAQSFFRTVTLTGTTRTPTPAQPLASPAPPSGGKICKGAPGRHLNWPASQRLAFYGREIFSWLRNIFTAEKYCKLYKSRHHTVKMSRVQKPIEYLLCPGILRTFKQSPGTGRIFSFKQNCTCNMAQIESYVLEFNSQSDAR